MSDERNRFAPLPLGSFALAVDEELAAYVAELSANAALTRTIHP
jgi:hypothetical protein